MLYIASAQPPTPIIQSILVADLTAPGSSSLVVAKPDRVEVWDVGPTGLVWKTDLEVWGSVVGIEKVVSKDARPHLLVLTGPPNAQVLVLAYVPSTSSIVVTSAVTLNPSTPSLRQAEFYRGIVAEGHIALVSLWVGVITCIELEVEKDKDLKRRRSSAVAAPVDALPEKRLRAKEPFNVNIYEQNLLSLAFHVGPPTIHGPIVSMLSLSPANKLQFQFRALNANAQSFHDLGKRVDMVCPGPSEAELNEDTDYSTIPFSCPGARHVIPIPGIHNERLALVVGDEFSVLYSFGQAGGRERVHSTSQASSPRASAVNRSPQTEAKQIGKRRKSSTTEGGGRWDIKPVWRMRQGFGTVLAATALESTSAGGSALLSDDCGRLMAFSWIFEHDGEGSRSVRVGMADMGSTSPASSLTRIGPSHLFCASANGDSSLISFQVPPPGPPTSPISPTSSPRSSRKGKGKGKETADAVISNISVGEPARGAVQTLERWMNLAPVKDFCVVEEDGGGSSHLVVASGASNANSLRIVKSGAGLEHLVHLEGIEGVERVWTLDHDSQASILLSTATSTSLLHMSPEIREADLASQIASVPSLAAALVPGTTSLVVVTEAAVTLWSDIVTGRSLGTWQAPAQITSAHINAGYVAISTQGGVVHINKATADSLVQAATLSVGSEITTVAMFASASSSPTVAVGTWTNEIQLFNLDKIDTSAVPLLKISESFYASSIILKAPSDTAGNLQVLAGLSDGSLITYELGATADGKLSMTGRKVSSLGSQPLALHSISGTTLSGDEQLLAVGLTDRMSILYGSRDTVEFSSVSLTGIAAATAVSLPAHGRCLVLATATGLSISKVNGLKKLHIQTMDLGFRSTHKLAWMPEHKSLAAGAVERRIDSVSGDYWQKSFVEIRDRSSLQVLAEVALEQREEVVCIASVQLSGSQYVAIGTAVHPGEGIMEDVYEDSLEPAKEGRLALYEPIHDQAANTWSIKEIAHVKTIGAVRDVVTIHGYLAFAASSTVMIHKFEDGALTELSRFSSTFVAQCLYTAPPWKHQAQEKLVVGDGMRSIIVLEIDDESGAIFSDQRDMATHQVSTMSSVKDRGQGTVIADGYNNIMTFRLTDRIEPAATLGLHEEIVAFRSGSFAPPTTAAEVIAPDLLYATSDGRLGMVGELSPPAAKILDDLQRNMDKYQKGPGGVSWRQYRRGGKPLVPRETAGFIDGDFVQKFLSMDFGTGQPGERVLKGGNVHERVSKLGMNGKAEGASRADVARVLEATAGLH